MADERLLRVETYNHLVQEYKTLDKQIDQLLTEHQGHTENMSHEAMQQYRNLARERDDLFNAMRAMEHDLFSDAMGD